MHAIIDRRHSSPRSRRPVASCLPACLQYLHHATAAQPCVCIVYVPSCVTAKSSREWGTSCRAAIGRNGGRKWRSCRRWILETTGSALASATPIGRFVLGPRRGSKALPAVPEKRRHPVVSLQSTESPTQANYSSNPPFAPDSPPSSGYPYFEAEGLIISDRSAILSAANTRGLTCEKARGGWRWLCLSLEGAFNL